MEMKKVPRCWDKIMETEVCEDGVPCTTIKYDVIPNMKKNDLKRILEMANVTYSTPIYYGGRRVVGLANYVSLDIYLDPSCWEDMGYVLLHECCHIYYSFLSESFVQHMTDVIAKNDPEQLEMCKKYVRDTIPEEFDIDDCYADFVRKLMKYEMKNGSPITMKFVRGDYE